MAELDLLARLLISRASSAATAERRRADGDRLGLRRPSWSAAGALSWRSRLTEAGICLSLPLMGRFNVKEAKAHFSELLDRAAAGEEILIAKAGKPVARLVPFTPVHKRVFGQDRGLFQVPDDFDAPLPDELQKSFEG